MLKPVVEMATAAAPVILAARSGGLSTAPAAMEQAAPAAKGVLGALQRIPGARMIGEMGKGGVTGGLFGALSGFSDEGDLGQRLEKANEGAAFGAAFGALTPPVVTGIGGIINAGKRLSAPRDTRAAAQAGRVLEERVGPSLALEAQGGDDLQLPFERMGAGGETTARAVASVPGPGQDIARSELVRRREGARSRILSAVRRDLGDDGASFHATREGLDRRRLQESRPLYAEAFEREPPVTNALERLKARPSIRKAMRRGRELALEEGENPNGLGLFDMENPADWLTDGPDAGRVAGEAERIAGFRRPPSAPRRGPSLAKFVADGGGLRDVGGDVTAMGGRDWHKGKAYQRGVIGEAADPDEWALRAWEAGYFPEHRSRPTVNEFLDALGDDIAGRRQRFARDADPRALDRIARFDEAEEMAYRGGSADDLPDPESYGQRPEPQTGPVYGETPTWKAWDYIKRGLDDELESLRDPTTGRLPRTDEVRNIERTRTELRRHLRDLNPKYGEALDAYAGPSRQMDAMSLGRRMVTGRMDAEDLATGMERFSADEAEAMRLGVARGLSDVFRSKDPQRTFRAFVDDELLQDRLRMGFGSDEAYARFMRDVVSEFEANLSYNRVLTGSRTTPLAEDIAAVNRAASGNDLLEPAFNFAQDPRSWRRQAFEWAATKLRQAREARSGLNNPEVSRLLGQALFRNGDVGELFEAMVRERVISPAEMRAMAPYLAAEAGVLAERRADASPN
ncbi:MAG: hypothetical protein JNK30_07150 [Phenylobacterium sp.]|nr:hypothetical protein [Phenylobacterium sp.]